MADFGDLLGDLNERELEFQEEGGERDVNDDDGHDGGSASGRAEEEDADAASPSLPLAATANEGVREDQPEEEENDDENVEIPTALQQERERQLRQQQTFNDDGNSNDLMDIIMTDHTLSQSVPSDDYESLKWRWIQEFNCAELLPYDHDLMEMLIGLVNSQNDILLDLQQGGNGDSVDVDPTLAGIAAGICKMDMDRLSFLLSDLMRIRIEKIERYWMDLIGLGKKQKRSNDDDSDENDVYDPEIELELQHERMMERMSENEIEYLQSYGALFRGHMERSVTDHFPKDAWKKIDHEEMIERPNLDTFCFCKVLDDEGVEIDQYAGIDVQKDNDDNIDDDDDDDDQDEDEDPVIHYDAGRLLFVRYRAVMELVSEGRVQLVM